VKLTPTGSQTVGPYFRIGLEYLCAKDGSARSAESVTITGRVLDADGAPVPDAMLEIYYSDPEGHDETPGAQAPQRPSTFVRVATNVDGQFRFAVARPEPGTEQRQAPHLAVLVFARGLLRHLITRMYFPDEPANTTDPILQSVPLARQHTMIARPDAQQPGTLVWNVVLQGKEETVFFAW
jgi:protocatechuate 3,4-dioxygenase, alpha subunit